MHALSRSSFTSLAGLRGEAFDITGTDHLRYMKINEVPCFASCPIHVQLWPADVTNDRTTLRMTLAPDLRDGESFSTVPRETSLGVLV